METFREKLTELENQIYAKFNELTKNRNIILDEEITVAEYSDINGEFINRNIVEINDSQLIEIDGDDTISFWDLSINDRLYLIEMLENI